MNREETKVLLMRQYLTAERGMQAMYLDEKQAQDNGLKQRIRAKESKIFPRAAIAALVAVVFTVGSLFGQNQHPANTDSIKQAVKTQDTTPAHVTPLKKKEISALRSKRHLKKAQVLARKKDTVTTVAQITPVTPKEIANNTLKTDTTAKDTTPLNEIVVMAVTGGDKKDKAATKNKKADTKLQHSEATATTSNGTGYSDEPGSAVTNPHPQDGWDSLKKYLNKNAVSPDNKKGRVKLSFMVDQNGAIKDIKVIKGLSSATDQKAIDLVVDGPAWVGSPSEQTEKVTLNVTFSR